MRDQLRRKTDATSPSIDRRRDGEIVTVGGIVSTLRQMTTKKGDPMVFLQLEDITGSAECVVFNSTYADRARALRGRPDPIVKGRIDHKEGETKLIALDVSAFEAIPERRDVRLKIDARQARAGVIRELAQLVKEFRGAAPVGSRWRRRRARACSARARLPGRAGSRLLRRGQGVFRPGGGPLRWSSGTCRGRC